MANTLERFLDGLGSINSEEWNTVSKAEEYGFTPNNPLVRTLLPFLKDGRDIESGGTMYYSDSDDQDSLTDDDFNMLAWLRGRYGEGRLEVKLNFYHFPTTKYIPLDALPSDTDIRKEDTSLRTDKFVKEQHKTMYELSIYGSLDSIPVSVTVEYNGSYHAKPPSFKTVYERGGIITPERLSRWTRDSKAAEEAVMKNTFLDE